MLLVGWQEGHLACKKLEWWVAGVDAAQLMPLPHTVSSFSKIHIGFTFLVPAHPGSPGKRAFKQVCVCVCNYRQNSTVQCVERRVHGLCKVVGIVFAGEVETINLPTVTPLVKCRRRLVVL